MSNWMSSGEAQRGLGGDVGRFRGRCPTKRFDTAFKEVEKMKYAMGETQIFVK